MELSYLAAFVVGLLGGVHCIGMCGGIVGALSFGLPEPARGRLGAMLPYLLNYNLGRLFSYALAGALLGGIGTLAAQLLLINQAQLVLQVVAGLFMIALGLYLGGWWFGITRLERLGSGLWSRLEPHARKLLPVRSPSQALLMGLVWGWLPCGLVYSMLIMAISAGSALDGALLLLSFGLGTLPNLLLMGVAAGKLTSLMRRPAVRRIAGASVILIGLYYISRPLLH
ncbi:MAG: sulfite exporter TauE/SafE family protein [Chromatiales bacterium]|nr:sulfite exporter TauE/SafE family protein [Gammaproteobacteria bacterium]MBW6475630.1 sulfite exporter TauE/SafE family protein [Chromatiales bacterium]